MVNLTTEISKDGFQRTGQAVLFELALPCDAGLRTFGLEQHENQQRTIDGMEMERVGAGFMNGEKLLGPARVI